MNQLLTCVFSAFYSGSVTFRKAGNCSASHWSDSASVCAAQTQPELLLFHLDHSSLPWMRMLKLTGLSSSSSVSSSLAFSCLSTSLVSLKPLVCFSALLLCFSFSSPTCSLYAFTSFCFFFVVLQKESGDWECGVSLHLRSAHFSGTVKSLPVQWMLAGWSSHAAFVVEEPVWTTLQVNSNSSSLGRSLVRPLYWSSKEMCFACWTPQFWACFNKGWRIHENLLI